MAETRSLLTSLLNYVIEQDKEIDPRGFKLQGHPFFIKAHEELRQLPGIDFDVQNNGDHIWMRVQRMEPVPPPAVSADAVPNSIVVGPEPSSPLPFHNKDVLIAVEQERYGSLEDEEDRAAAEEAFMQTARDDLAEYLAGWRKWAAVELVRRKTIDIYSELFAYKHMMEAEETARPMELVWGIGVSAWRMSYSPRGTPTSFDYQYPLLTQSMEISLDSKTMALEVRPRAVPPRFEFDAFAACELPATAETERMARLMLAQSEDLLVTPFDTASYEPYLRYVAGNMHERGRFVDNSISYPTAGDDLVVSDACTLFGRPRDNNYLHEDIQRLKKSISEETVIPPGPLALVTPPIDEVVHREPIRFRGSSGAAGSRGGTGEVRELYFPLPYNQEQVTVIEQLESSYGTVVQGPPGTGKTHTIANIICHFLATGRRVLVTSKGEPALAVLQDKIPPEVRALTVALLSGDREGLRQFQASIEAIIHNISHLQPAQTEDQIARLRSGIEQAHTELSDVDRRIDEIATAQLSELEVDGVPMRAERMAELVVDGQEKYGWFTDSLSLSLDNAPPLMPEAAARLRDARRRLGTDLPILDLAVPKSAVLPAPSQIGQWQEALLRMHELDDAEKAGTLERLVSTSPEVLVNALQLRDHLDKALQLVRELDESGEEWWPVLRARCAHARYQTERDALEALLTEVQKLFSARAALLQRPVTVPPTAFSNQKVREAVARGAETGKPFSFISFGAGDAKDLVGQITVSGLPPADADGWKHVKRYMRLHSEVLSFTVRWNEVASLLGIPKFNGGVEILRELSLAAKTAQSVHQLSTVFDSYSVALAEQVFMKPPADKLRGSPQDMLSVREQLAMHLSRSELALARASVAKLREALAEGEGPLFSPVRSFCMLALGSKELSSAQAESQFAEILREIHRLEALAPDVAYINECTKQFAKAGASQLAHRLRTEQLEGLGDDPVLPTTWREAWTWARLRSHLESIESREELRTLSTRRKELEKGLSRLYVEIVSRSAWLSTKNMATPKVLSALKEYQVAVQRIGAGTGTNAGRYRQDARKAMLSAQGAIPCWIMSHAKVSESLPATLGAFDLVIVDEASQSNLWALPAVLRGKKILVVGDDKQVSPAAGFTLATRIQELKDRFLGGQPYSSVLTPEKSLYDLASTVFAAQQVMLREHFRCVPSIISYSNSQFYKDQIQPLRTPRPSERLDPPLVDILVRGGQRLGKDINKQEAEAILHEIETIIADPKMAGRTLGVVSLLGLEQAKYVDTLVRSRIDAKELLDREFDCGDARIFQGGERDIVFLTMVVDADNCRALSGNMFEQRFNVAASRARDRMYLVRSVTLGELSHLDLRRGLLEHFSQPADANQQSDGESGLAKLCESGFELQVFTELANRGYRVVPQVSAGAFRIDMVVEGGDDHRLAIECDGDAFHGPDRWAADMSRQRILERAGWTFWRCFASAWKMDKQGCLDDLLGRLNAMGIEPLGAVNRLPALVESRVWPPVESEEDYQDPLAVLEEVVSEK